MTINRDADGDLIEIEGDGVKRVIVNSQLFAGFEGVRINTRGGNDTITIEGLQISGDLRINTGGNHDLVALCSGNTYLDDVRVNGASGFDTLETPPDRTGTGSESKGFEQINDYAAPA